MNRLWISLLVLASAAFAQEPFRTITIDAGDLPKEFEVDVAEDGLLWGQLGKYPKGFAFHWTWAGLPAGTWATTWAQARVTKGKHKFVLKDRWNAKRTGSIELALFFKPGLDATEPANGKKDGARKVESGMNRITLFPVKDEDWLTFEVPEPGYVFLKLKEKRGKHAMWGTIYDSFGIARGTNAARIDFAGPVSIHYRDRWGAWSEPKPLDVEIVHAPEIDFLEPNDVPSQATRLRNGEWVEIAMCAFGDKDHFRVKAPGRGMLACEWRDAPFDLSMEWLDTDGKPVGKGWGHHVDGPGEYIVRVRSRWNNAKLQAFPFRVNFASAGDSVPKELALDTPLRLRDMGPYKVTVAPGKPGLVHLHAYGTAMPPVFVFGKTKGRRLVVRSDGSPFEVTIQSQKNPTFWYFNVKATLEPEFDQTEPDDTIESAKPLVSGKTNWLYLYPSTDADWFSFETKSKARLVGSLFHATESLWNIGLVPTITIHDETGKEVARFAEYRKGLGDYYGGADVPGAGRYFLRIGAAGRSSRLPLSFEAHVHEEGSTGADPNAVIDLKIVGVELADNVAASMRDYARAGGGAFLEAKQAKEIAPRLREAVAPPPEPEPAPDEPEPKTEPEDEEKGGVPWWLILLLVVVGTAFWLGIRS